MGNVLYRNTATIKTENKEERIKSLYEYSYRKGAKINIMTRFNIVMWDFGRSIEFGKKLNEEDIEEILLNYKYLLPNFYKRSGYRIRKNIKKIKYQQYLYSFDTFRILIVLRNFLIKLQIEFGQAMKHVLNLLDKWADLAHHDLIMNMVKHHPDPPSGSPEEILKDMERFLNINKSNKKEDVIKIKI
jgi:hypothetical protein